ncbi:lytic transglycosylase domain-containing protein [Undibacterium sp. CY7W]|uniref:Lytic transglycosylase domain-containing protein n=1 Tax=Undibacterium rugosum TaxID=2762291 RepID=A0A923HZD7_9BURK|nr:lytic transglycosylase domain-containing protein [Undibacterium rugosum]
MLQRINLAVPGSSAADDQRPAQSAPAFASAPALMHAVRQILTISGVIAMLALATMFFKPELADKFKNLSPFATTEEDVAEAEVPPPSLAMLMQAPGQAKPEVAAQNAVFSEEDAKMLGNQRQQQWVTNWLSKRYRIATDATNMLVSAAYLTAKEIKLDPLLILSVMAIESGLNPFAESPVGAQGLMQVMSKVHHEKFQEMGGVKAALNPVANIKVGALILKDYVSRGGSVEAGLKMYVGAGAMDSDSGYGSRVLTEYKRLKDVSAGKNVPTVFSNPAPAAVPVIRNTETVPVIRNDQNEAKAKTEAKDQVAAL